VKAEGCLLKKPVPFNHAKRRLECSAAMVTVEKLEIKGFRGIREGRPRLASLPVGEKWSLPLHHT